MPAKADPYSSPSQKVLGLYCLLLFTGRSYTLPQLSRELRCSKQTVMRLVEQIGRSFGGEVESRLEKGTRVYWMPGPKVTPRAALSAEDIQQLELCRGMVLHLLPEGIREQARHAIAKAATLLADQGERDQAFAPVAVAGFKGRIDYTPHQERLAALIAAIRGKGVCEVTYHAPNNPQPRTYAFAPQRLVAYREALYVTGWRVADEGAARPLRSIMLAVHRLHGVRAQSRAFGMEPRGGERAELFGLMEGEPFRGKVKFHKDVAAYVAERIWSEDQKITRYKNGNVLLEFTARSMPEVVSWVLSFGSGAKALAPGELVARVAGEVRALGRAYG